MAAGGGRVGATGPVRLGTCLPDIDPLRGEEQHPVLAPCVLHQATPLPHVHHCQHQPPASPERHRVLKARPGGAAAAAPGGGDDLESTTRTVMGRGHFSSSSTHVSVSDQGQPPSKLYCCLHFPFSVVTSHLLLLSACSFQPHISPHLPVTLIASLLLPLPGTPTPSSRLPTSPPPHVPSRHHPHVLHSTHSTEMCSADLSVCACWCGGWVGGVLGPLEKGGGGFHHRSRGSMPLSAVPACPWSPSPTWRHAPLWRAIMTLPAAFALVPAAVATLISQL